VAVDGKSRGILNDEELTILLCHSSIYHYLSRKCRNPEARDGKSREAPSYDRAAGWFITTYNLPRPTSFCLQALWLRDLERDTAV